METGAHLRYAILGNHDWHQGKNASMAQLSRVADTDDDEWHMPSTPVYTVTESVGDAIVKLVMVDTTTLAPHVTRKTRDVYGTPELVQANLAKVDAAIAAAADDATWLIVAGHYPVRSVGDHADTLQLTKLLLPILLARGVDAYLCGHDHSLQSLVDVPTGPAAAAKSRAGRGDVAVGSAGRGDVAVGSAGRGDVAVGSAGLGAAATDLRRRRGDASPRPQVSASSSPATARN